MPTRRTTDRAGQANVEPAAPRGGPAQQVPAARPAELSVPNGAGGAARAKLVRLGAERARRADALEEAELDLYAAIREANAAEVPKLTIAKDAGVSRQTVYNVLERAVG